MHTDNGDRIIAGEGATLSVDKSVHIHVHVHSSDEKLINKVMRSINGLIGKRSIAIESASGLSENDIRGRIVRKVENKQLCGSA